MKSPRKKSKTVKTVVAITLNRTSIQLLAEASRSASAKQWQRRKREVVAPLERRLSRQMSAYFEKQKKAFMKQFRTLRPLFPRVSESSSSIQEAVTPSDINPLLDASAEAVHDEGAESIQEVAEAAVLAGGQNATRTLGGSIAFDLSDPNVVEFLANYGADRITLVEETTKTEIRAIIVKAAEEGWSWQRTAEAITDKFDSFAGPMLRGGNKSFSNRAQLVAVTELANGYEEGARIGAKNLQAAGLGVEKFWSGPNDNRTSAGCEENIKAGWIDIDDEFPSGDLRPPRFPGCRHAAIYRRKR